MYAVFKMRDRELLPIVHSLKPLISIEQYIRYSNMNVRTDQDGTIAYAYYNIDSSIARKMTG